MILTPSTMNFLYKLFGVSMFLAGIAFIPYAFSLGIISFIIPIGIALIGLYLFSLARSSITINDQSISVTDIHGKYQIKWDEIKEIEKSPFSFQNEYKLIGENKHLVLKFVFAPKNWQQAVTEIENHANKLGIRIKYAFLIHETNWNTKIKKNA